MAYSNRNSLTARPGVVAAVLGIHAIVGYGLVTGLAPGVFTEFVDKNLPAITIPMPTIPPPPPTPAPNIDSTVPIKPPVSAPMPKLALTPQPDRSIAEVTLPDIDAPIVMRGGDGPIAGAGGTLTPLPNIVPDIPTVPRVDPVAARPSNDPGGWITDRDYKSRWANEELTGIARFRLQLSARGRVTDCAITASSGHAALDQATCALVTKRARFNPAKDDTGAKTTGTYRGAVQWTLPR